MTHCLRYESGSDVSLVPHVEHAYGRLIALTFNCRVVFVYKMALNQLYCETALPYTSAAHHYQLVFPEELRDLLACAGANGVATAA